LRLDPINITFGGAEGKIAARPGVDIRILGARGKHSERNPKHCHCEKVDMGLGA